MTKEIPFITIVNGELDNNKDIEETHHCKRCGEDHIVEYGTDSNGKEVKLLAFVKCGDVVYLAGMGGKLLN